MRPLKAPRAGAEKLIGYCILVPFGIVAICLALVGDFIAAACFFLPPIGVLCLGRWLGTFLDV